MRFILVLQLAGSTEDDFDSLVAVEGELGSSLGEYASVDGHDFGSGEMNIFIETDDPLRAFAAVQDVLIRNDRWSGLIAAYREASGENYTVLWPFGLESFEIK